MTPYDCPICGTKLKVNSPQVIGVHERGKVHQAALKKKTDEPTVKAQIPEQPKTQKLDIKPVEPKKNVENQKTEKDEEWGGFFG